MPMLVLELLLDSREAVELHLAGDQPDRLETQAVPDDEALEFVGGENVVEKKILEHLFLHEVKVGRMRLAVGRLAPRALLFQAAAHVLEHAPDFRFGHRELQYIVRDA
ncbi:hypothetical protein [Cohnella rhizosphaerae]|uniref:Uncharacterized protein n=1 Tax=Cohnella rhizosphaerae TaxID=1457232 RepID=A0A9X4KYT2_9BACL|nr:hypothetical protein [Cohnella rhizosphaerae]MDG0812978.1 hypothetical protein [Cohnella rhizosphaerae]